MFNSAALVYKPFVSINTSEVLNNCRTNVDFDGSMASNVFFVKEYI